MANTTAISAVYSSTISVTETYSGFTDINNNSLLVNGISESGTLTASTTVPATVDSQFTVTMSGGVGSINLAAIPGLNSSDVIDATGLKLQLFKFTNPSSNANSITVAKGASNGYGLNASGTTWSVPISPGQSILLVSADVAPDVASGARVIDVTGTGSQVLNVAVVLG